MKKTKKNTEVRKIMTTGAGRTAACGAALFGVFLLSGCGTAPAASNVNAPSSIQVINAEDQVISVTATEEVKVVPDMAEASFSVTTQAEDPKACQTANSSAVNQVVEAVRAKGIEEASIQTSSYNLNPIYDWDNGQVITGYSMDTSVTVSDIPVDTVGDVIAAAVDGGANNIQSVTYMYSRYDESYQEALAKAVESAYKKANAMAIAGGCSLGEVVKIEERSWPSEARYTALANMSMDMAYEEAGGSAAVMPGQVSVQADILVEYAVNR